LDQFTNLRGGGVIAMTLQTGDRVLDVAVSDGRGDILLATRRGRVIRFPEEDVTAVGRSAQGVRGIKLNSGDRVASIIVARRNTALCSITERGWGKQTPLAEFALQKRGGLGTVATPTSRETGSVILVREVVEGETIALISNAARAYQFSADTLPIEEPGAPGVQIVLPEFGESLLDATVPAARRVRTDEIEDALDEVGPDEEYEAETEGELDAEDTGGDEGRDDPDSQYDLLGAEIE
jgi:DNA gyrase subunit A